MPLSRRPALLLAALLGACSGSRGGAPPSPAAAATPPVDRARLGQVTREMQELGVCTPGCLDTLRALREAFPRDAEVRAALKQAYLQRRDWDALWQLEQERPAGARTPAEQVELASIEINAGRYAEAVASLEPLLAARPADAELARLAGQVYFHLGDHDRAAPLLDRAMAGLRGEEGAEAATFRGLLHFHRGEEAAAEQALRQATRLAPDYLPALNALGRVLAARGAEAQAREALARARRLQEAVSTAERRQLRLSALSQMASDAFQQGRHDEAERLIAEMLEVADDGVKVQLYRYLAQVRKAAGRSAAAQAALEQAQRLERGAGAR